MRITILGVVALSVLAQPALFSSDWPQFRGVNSAGVARGPAPPIEFGPGKNQHWRVPLASGHSSPCVAGDSIYVTAFDDEGKKLTVVRIARSSGEIRWERSVDAGEIETGHPSFNPASSTPASDGERVVAYFGSYGLICFDADGAKQWDIPMPLTKSYSGNATSPIIVGDQVILYRGNYVDHFLLAVDKKTGEQRWKVPFPERFTPDQASAATPIVAGQRLIVHSVRAVQAFDIESGKSLWKVDCATTATSTPVIAGGEVITATWNQTGEPALTPVLPTYAKLVEENDENDDGAVQKKEFPKLMVFHRSEGTDAPQNGYPLSFRSVDKDKSGSIDEKEWATKTKEVETMRKRRVAHGILAIRIDSDGEVDPEKVRTLERQGIPEVPSPLVHDGLVYFVKNGGILTCLDVKTGERVYRMRTKGRGTHYASPILAGGKLYSTAGNGRISVIEAGREPKVVATNDMGERTYATPAAADGTLYVRTFEALYAFGVEDSKAGE